ncbi:hypothetical protein TWF730_005290 [Orbilia blumenaviensis]|uniref:HhH-GPD domain-containing protein n=1 Tax=Orbilia blumenaviensis TaxID=1796055 RepID=A0AAV9VHY3_9PEZI
MTRQLRSTTRATASGATSTYAPRDTVATNTESTIPATKTNIKTSKSKPTSTSNHKNTSKRKATLNTTPPPAKKKKKPVPSDSYKKPPFQTHPFPTPSQCHLVHTLLTTAHGPAIRPTTVTASTRHAGCGEVPSVLDSLLRTVLSANTSAGNSTRAFHGLIKRFGKDPTHGGVNWSMVRESDVKEVYKAIECGGLANVKSKAIKGILEEVYEDGMKRRKERGNGKVIGDKGVMSLDYLRDEGDEEVMRILTGFKGVGVKTATCVMMFCLQRPAFPVDTHVFRISQLLGWVPTPGYKRELMAQESKIAPLELPSDDEYQHKDGYDSDRVDREKSFAGGSDHTKINGSKRRPVKQHKGTREVKVTRDTTFLHLDARVPDELKYGLHQLMIRHGRYCPTCNAAGGRKFGIGQNGKTLVPTKKKVIIKEENADGVFEESITEVLVKEEAADSDNGYDDMAPAPAPPLLLQGDASTAAAKSTDAGGSGVSNGVDAVKIEDQDQDADVLASELNGKPYVPIDAAGGTGEKTGGNPDGSCILGDLISWERLV